MAALTVVVLVATPLLAFAGGMAGHVLTRRASRELDRWRKREETTRMLRWATELATDADAYRARTGVAVLTALLDSPLLDRDDVELVAAITLDIARASFDD